MVIRVHILGRLVWIWIGKRLFLDFAKFAFTETLDANVRFSLVSKNMVTPNPQCFRSGFNDSGCGSRVLMTKIGKNLIFLDQKIAIYLSLGLHKGRPIYRRSLQPPKREPPSLQNMKFLFLWVIFALLDPNPLT